MVLLLSLATAAGTAADGAACTDSTVAAVIARGLAARLFAFGRRSQGTTTVHEAR